MEAVLAEQAQAFLYAALLGMALGLFYDILRVLRLTVGAGRLLTGLLDFLFCFVCAAGFFALTLVFCQGQVRSYGLAGVGLGGVLYAIGPSPFLLSLLRPLARFLHGLPRKIQDFLKKTWPDRGESK